MLKWICFVVLCAVGLFVVSSTFASDLELRNLRWDWEVYDEDSDHFVPFYKQPNTQSVRFDLDLNKYRKAYLKLVLPEGYFIWIHGELVGASSVDMAKLFSLDSLYDVYDKGHLYVELYSKAFRASDVSTTIVNMETDDQVSAESTSIFPRKNHKEFDLFIIISVLTMSLIAIFRAFNFRLFTEYFSLAKSVQVRQNFDLITAHAPVAWPNIAFIIFYAVLVGNCAMNLSLFQLDESIAQPFYLSSTNSVSLGLTITIYCFVFMLAKVLLVSLGAELFKLKKIKSTHFFTYFRQSLIMAILAFSFSVINGVFGGKLVNNYWNIIQLLVAIAWIGRMILIFFVLNKIYTFRKLHLFSYLCSSELIPLLLFFKIFLK